MSTSPQEIPDITATELKERLDGGHPVVLVDVREPHEWEIANLGDHGAILRPMDDIWDWKDDLDPSAEVVVYCRSGNRSAWIVRDLLADGFENVRNLRGGINAWADDVDPTLARY